MNKDILIRAGKRWFRSASAIVLAAIIPEIIRILGELQFSVEVQAIITGVLIPTLLALDKIARDKGWY